MDVCITESRQEKATGTVYHRRAGRYNDFTGRAQHLNPVATHNHGLLGMDSVVVHGHHMDVDERDRRRGILHPAGLGRQLGADQEKTPDGTEQLARDHRWRV
jgi:hypothetical protein